MSIEVVWLSQQCLKTKANKKHDYHTFILTSYRKTERIVTTERRKGSVSITESSYLWIRSISDSSRKPFLCMNNVWMKTKLVLKLVFLSSQQRSDMFWRYNLFQLQKGQLLSKKVEQYLNEKKQGKKKKRTLK